MTKDCSHGRGKEVSLAHLEESLRRLQTDHLDLWMIHQIDGRRNCLSATRDMETFDEMFEIGTAIVFLVLGIWATAFGYGLAGDRLIGGLRWHEGFKRQLRWLGPVLVLLSVASIVIILKQ